jgi:hypothetical protein
LATTFDGASVNRRFVAIHNTADKLHYKLRNIYAVERYIYCFNDALHLIKTTQNCWCSKKRKLWIHGKGKIWKIFIVVTQGRVLGLHWFPSSNMSTFI